MVIRKLELVAPNGLPIVGVLLEDGSVCDFEYTFDTATHVYVFELKNHVGAVMQDGRQVLVDSADNKWPSTDIEFLP